MNNKGRKGPHGGQGVAESVVTMLEDVPALKKRMAFVTFIQAAAALRMRNEMGKKQRSSSESIS